MTSHIAPLPDCFVDDGIVMCQVMRGAPCSRVNDSLDPQDTRRRAATNDLSHRKNVAAEARCSRLSRERFSALARGFFGSGTILPSKSEVIWITADISQPLVPGPPSMTPSRPKPCGQGDRNSALQHSLALRVLWYAGPWHLTSIQNDRSSSQQSHARHQAARIPHGPRRRGGMAARGARAAASAGGCLVQLCAGRQLQPIEFACVPKGS
jgi:hypothetical protein